MWITCYNCNGSGIQPIKENNTILPERKNKENLCRVCDRYRATIHNYEFYGQIWTEDNETITPPTSPRE